MNEAEFEGTRVLEQLAEHGCVEDFFDAIDEDNLDKARILMKRCGIDAEAIKFVLKLIREEQS